MGWFLYDKYLLHERVKLCKHIFFKEDAEQKHARIFSNNESFIFDCNNSTNFQSVVYIKTVKKYYSKNIIKAENRGHGFICPLVGFISLPINNELFKTAILLVQEFIK